MLALNSGPNCACVSLSAGPIRGAATPIDWISNPSPTAASAQRARVQRAARPVDLECCVGHRRVPLCPCIERGGG